MKKLLLFLALVLTLNAYSQVPPYVPVNGLVGWWPFNGNANDESGNGINGTVNGATLTTDRFGIPNAAYSFNGFTNKILLDNSSLLDIRGSISISLWFKKDTAVARTLLYRGDVQAAHDPYDVYFDSTNIKYRRDVGTGNTTKEIDYPAATFDTLLWYHIVSTYDSITGVMSIYKNGVLANQHVLPANMNYVTSDKRTEIGTIDNFPGFQGKIDDIGIWNRVLTPMEVQELYGTICFQTITVTDTLIINDDLLGINPVAWQHTIKIYPNPTNDHITIDYGDYISFSGYTLKIYNSIGVLVFNQAITTSSTNVDISTWTGSGVYFVHLINPQGETLTVREIVIQ